MIGNDRWVLKPNPGLAGSTAGRTWNSAAMQVPQEKTSSELLSPVYLSGDETLKADGNWDERESTEDGTLGGRMVEVQ